MMRPVAQPVARTSLPGKSRSGPGFPPVTTRKDPLSARRSSRISARQLDRIASNLTPLDSDVLGFVATLRLATGTQLVRHFWTAGGDDRAAQARIGRRALKRLAEWRVLDRLPDRSRGGVRGGSDTFIYAVGRSGARLLAGRGLVQRRLGTPGERHIAHTLTTTELVVRLHEADRGGRLELLEVQAEPTCWRPFLGLMGARLILKPDLFLRIGAGALEDRWMVEVDMATEHHSTLRTKLSRYYAHYRTGTEQHEHSVYPRVLWVVPDAHRAEQVAGVVRRLPTEARRLFSVCVFDQAVAFLTAEACS
jgi:hypothetical protein